MELLPRAFCAALSAIAVFYWLVKFSLGYWKRRGILHQKPKFLFGNIKGVLKGKQHLSEALQLIYDGFKGRGAPFIGFYVGIKPFVLVLDQQLAQHILVKDAGHFTSRGLYHNLRDEPLSGNLLQLDGHKWRELHAQTSSVYTAANVEKLMPKLLTLASEFKPEQQGICNISELVESYNIEVITSLAYGLSRNNWKQQQLTFRQMTRSYWSKFSLWKAYLALEWPLLARFCQTRSYEQQASSYFLKLAVEQLQRQREKESRGGAVENFLFAELSLNETQIAAQVFGYILAGLAPLNATLSFCLYELALQPALQQRVREEIQTAMGQQQGQLTAEGLKGLKYTQQVLKETLRLHSPYPFLLRRATRSYEVPKSVFMIARGNNVLIPTCAIHRDASIYPEPQRFDPDRFKAAALAARPTMSFLPFGAGLRGCPASQLAEQQLLVGLVTLLRDHSYSPCSETSIPLQYDNGKIVLMPKTDIKLSVELIRSD